MREHFHTNQSCQQIQRLLERIFHEVDRLYSVIAPWYLRHRRNIHLQKQKDTVLIAVYILGKMLGFTSERMWHSFVCANLFVGRSFPERSRYHRRCRHLIQIIKSIRFRLVQLFSKRACYAVIDSIPLPLCHPARMYRVKRLKEIADIGYCASKQERYYGLKGSFQVTDEGVISSYVISAASIHDVKLVEELVEQCPHLYTLADKGYISERLRQKLKNAFGIHLLVPPRSNQKQAFPKSLMTLIYSKRKQIETLFAGLVDALHLKNIRATSTVGFELALEGILLAHTLLVQWAISSNGHGHRWKEQIFTDYRNYLT